MGKLEKNLGNKTKEEKLQNDPLDHISNAIEFAKLTSLEISLHQWIKKKFGSLPRKSNREWIEIFQKEGVISSIPTIFQQ